MSIMTIPFHKGLFVLFLFISASTITKEIADNVEINLDGVINKEEWVNAKEYSLSKEYPSSNGGKLLVLHRDNTLYLSIKGNSPGWSHVYLHRNDSVSVLHASAALGDQLYINKDQLWKLQNKFSWELRDEVFNESTKQKMENYYNTHGWCSNNNSLGDGGTFEFKIDLRRFPLAQLSFVALVAADDAKLLAVYPDGLTDDIRFEKLVRGGSPDNLQFKPSTWTKLSNKH
jgi:hypothetical protein